MADHPSPCARQQHTGDCELETLARRLRRGASRASRAGSSPRGRDDSSLIIAVDHEACILCDRCIRGCDEIKKNMVIGRSGQGLHGAASPSTSTCPMGSSTCVSCGECMVSCPTGALTNKRRSSTSSCRTATTCSTPSELLQPADLRGRLGDVPGAEPGRRGPTALQAGRGHLPRGEFGSTAFYILERHGRGLHQHADRARRSSEDAAAGGVVQPHQQPSWSRPRRSTREAKRASAATSRSTPPVDLPLRQAVAAAGGRRPLRRDDLHELLPALGHRAGAKTTVVVLEMLRNVLDILQKNKTFQAELDRQLPRARARDPPAERPGASRRCSATTFIDYLRDRVELIRSRAGRGDRPPGRRRRRLLPGAHRLREGHRRRIPGGDLVLRYLGRGATTSARSGLLGGGRPHGDLHRARPRRGRPDRRRGLPR